MKRFGRMLGGSLAMCVFLSCIFYGTPAFAGWGDWSEHEIPAYSYFTVYFTPCAAGDHEIEFANQWDVYNGGTMWSAWADLSESPPSWSTWAESDVLNTIRQQDLYAGSEDIGFRFTFYNEHSYPVDFFWRFYTDN